ncbi:MAG TPA: 6-carboxytetrahydropterin synthase QueD [Acidimicrobiales bacterium]|jgi:6-pyruvoyltetrahydropterin/6-carboxytetrahydropterin synthase|nr:6-carboxytetrahydropterin synthase QueD [Acidimicrobiales bacterium]
MRTSVTRSFTFEAAHQLPWHPGKCQRLHGHSYRLEVTVDGPVGEQGIVVDFGDIKEVVRRDVIARYDHQYLNDLMENPTAELLAHEIWKTVEAADLPVSRIRLWETADSWVDVERDR